MILVIGGAYQGKLDYVLENYPSKTVFQCGEENVKPDFSADVYNSLHLMVLAQLRAGIDSVVYFSEVMPRFKDKILICDDICCGVVPVDYEARIWRETTGRVLALLSKSADEVVRVFCGIGSRIK